MPESHWKKPIIRREEGTRSLSIRPPSKSHWLRSYCADDETSQQHQVHIRCDHRIRRCHRAVRTGHCLSWSLSEGNLLSGEPEYQVCVNYFRFQVVKYPIENIPQSDEALGAWLINLWRRKEEKLRKFYEMPRNVRQFENTPDGIEYELDNNTEMAQKWLIGFWCFTTVFWMFMFFEVRSWNSAPLNYLPISESDNVLVGCPLVHFLRRGSQDFRRIRVPGHRPIQHFSTVRGSRTKCSDVGNLNNFL